MRAPSPRPASTKLLTLRHWLSDTSGPISVSGSIGSPTRYCCRRTDKCVDERIVQFPLHEQARACRTALAGISKSTLDGGGRGLGYIGIGEDDIRALAAELERNALDPVGRHLEQARAGARLAGEGDLVDQRMRVRCARQFAHLGPGSTLSTPSGTPASMASRPNSSDVSGV